MKGTIISGEEILKRVSTGEWNAVKNIYSIKSVGRIEIIPIAGQVLGAIISDCNDPKVVFVELTKEEQ